MEAIKLKKRIKENTLKFIGIILISFWVIYFAPTIIIKVFWILIIFRLLETRNPIFWLGFLLMFADSPYVFFLKGLDAFQVGKLKLGILEIASIIFFYKVNQSSSLKRSYNPYQGIYNIYIIYLIILIVYGLIIGMSMPNAPGSGLTQYLNTFFLILLLPFLFTIPKLLYTNENNIHFIANQTFILVVLSTIMILFRAITKQDFVSLMPNAEIERDFLDRVGIRGGHAFFLNHLTLLFGFYYIINKKYDVFSRTKIYLMVFLPIFNVLMGATRGWIISIAITILIIFFLIDIKQKLRFIYILSLLSIIFIILYFSAPSIRNQTDYATQRLMTIAAVGEGDLTMEGTNSRLTTRLEPVLQKFEERPIFGWGFTSTAQTYKDQHVGWINLLMTGGIVGALIIIRLLLAIFLRTKSYATNHAVNKNLAMKITILIIASLIGLIIVHSTSGQIFGYIIYTIGYHRYKIFIISFIISIYGLILLSTKKYT